MHTQQMILTLYCRSESLVNITRTKGFECMVADGIHTPFRSNIFVFIFLQFTDNVIQDAVISVAVIHHFSTHERRLHAVRELLRIAKPGGYILIYVWALEQQKQKYTEQDVFVPWQLQKRFNAYGTAPTEANAEKKEQSGELVYKRYYHLFKKGELEELVMLLGQNVVHIEESLYEHDNWCVVAKKIQ